MLDELADSMRRTDELDKKAAGCAAANFELVDEFILRSARNAEVAVHDERYLVSGERFINVSDFFVDTTSSTPNSDVASKVRPCGAMLPAIDETIEIHPEMTIEP